MRFTESPVAGAFIVDLEPRVDERGFFARAFCAREASAAGLDSRVAQINFSSNARAGTVRGMHYQAAPAVEPKVIRCITGSIYDVIVDMRPDSPSYLMHFGLRLSAANRRALYVPGLCAHGFQTLENDTDVLYQVGEFYTPEAERGLRPDDPALQIEWPLGITCISEKDCSWALLDGTATR